MSLPNSPVTAPSPSPREAAARGHIIPRRSAAVQPTPIQKPISLGKVKETRLVVDGNESKQESKASLYTRRLQEGADFPGILAVTNVEGVKLLPFEHQRQLVKRFMAKTMKWMVVSHDAGLGKTATAIQVIAALFVLYNSCKTVVVAPPSTLQQWWESLRDWLRRPETLPNGTQVGIRDDEIFMPLQAKKVTPERIANAKVVVISRHLLATLYKTCFEYRKKSSGGTTGWQRKEGTEMHPFFNERWDLMVVDEAHFMRNVTTEWAVSHRQLAHGWTGSLNGRFDNNGGARKKLALTATPVMNRPSDMLGLMASIDAEPETINGKWFDFQDRRVWSQDNKGTKLSMMTVNAYLTHVDRVKDSMLDLPPILQEVVDFETKLLPEEVKQYNDLVASARSLKMRIEGFGAAKAEDLQKLMAMLLKMQQTLVSPHLATVGAEFFKQNPDLFEQAAKRETGSLSALYDQLVRLQKDGHKRIVVACEQPTLMHIAIRYLELRKHSMGLLRIYDGTLTQKQRTSVKHEFLHSKSEATLFLSIGAGGTGLHLVAPDPYGCRAMIFWGARSYSPLQVWQTMKRIHRIGQNHPVTVVHLIARMSVDDAIDKVHADKNRLSDVITGDDPNAIGESGEWRKTGRIVDGCGLMNENGNFPKEGEERIDGKRILPPSIYTKQHNNKRKATVAMAAPSGSTSLVTDFPIEMKRPKMDTEAPSVEELWNFADTAKVV